MTIMTCTQFIGFLAVLVVVSVSAGCSSRFNYASLGNLRRLAQNQGEKARCVRRSTALYERLRRDVEANRLAKGMAKRRVCKMYGPPFAESQGASAGETRLTYHHPAEYFTVPMYYLFFDADGLLLRWEAVEWQRQAQ
jgi:hypothetical protein